MEELYEIINNDKLSITEKIEKLENFAPLLMKRLRSSALRLAIVQYVRSII